MSRKSELEGLLQRAGLSPDAEVEELGVAQPVHEPGAIARGHAATASLDLQALCSDDFHTLALPAAVQSWFRIDRSVLRPSVLVARLAAGARWVFGDVSEPEGELRESLVNTESGPALLRYATSDAVYLLEMQDGNVRVERAATPAPRAPELTPPTLDALLGSQQLDGWLRAATEARLGAEDGVTRAAGAALVARHWSPAPGAAAELLQRRLSGEAVSPAQQLVAWARELEANIVRQVARVVAARAEQLLRRLEQLIDAPPASEEELAGQARGLLHGADELRSVATVVFAACRGPAGQDATVQEAREQQQRALDELHERLVDALPIWLRAPDLPADPWLRAIAANDPSSAAAAVVRGDLQGAR